jgi:hypothetical protein
MDRGQLPSAPARQPLRQPPRPLRTRGRSCRARIRPHTLPPCPAYRSCSPRRHTHAHTSTLKTHTTAHTHTHRSLPLSYRALRSMQLRESPFIASVSPWSGNFFRTFGGGGWCVRFVCARSGFCVWCGSGGWCGWCATACARERAARAAARPALGRAQLQVSRCPALQGTAVQAAPPAALGARTPYAARRALCRPRRSIRPAVWRLRGQVLRRHLTHLVAGLDGLLVLLALIQLHHRSGYEGQRRRTRSPGVGAGAGGGRTRRRCRGLDPGGARRGARGRAWCNARRIRSARAPAHTHCVGNAATAAAARPVHAAVQIDRDGCRT